MQGLYSRLAIDGIRKNGKLYFPYLLSAVGMVAIYYILTYLSKSPALSIMGGGSNMRTIMVMGKAVMSVFSVCFLFYTNSFLAKKRNKEFALYNILGMNKKNVIRIIAGETAFCGFLSVVTGLITGILLSKLFEIALLKLCGYTPDYAVYYSWGGVIETAILFAAIFFVLFIFAGARVVVNRPIELLRSTKAGEKEPKANWIFAILGAVVLIWAYYLAVSIDNPVAAINVFFTAVLMVIGATYLLFISGSVFLCKILKKNKNYYYNPKHYVAVSGMMYRMKRNGAGLATVCILCTMVLVMITSAGSLYIGANDSIDSMYPKDINVVISEPSFSAVSDENMALLDKKVDEICKDVNMQDVLKYRCMALVGFCKEGGVELYGVKSSSAYLAGGNAAVINIYSLDDYNKYGEPVFLNDGEILLSLDGKKSNMDSFMLDDISYKVAGPMDSRMFAGYIDIAKYVDIVVKDFDDLAQILDAVDDSNISLYYQYGYFFDDNLSKEENILLGENLEAGVSGFASVVSKADYKASFVELYGSLFLLGIFLSVAFIGATVLIIYYKQITEGYEDAHGYSIMRKVGMTKDEIRAGVNSQTLVTFFSPLVMAGIHLAFSFPLIRKILKIFGVGNLPLLIGVYAGFFLIFSLLYLFVYRKTVKAYVEIVAL